MATITHAATATWSTTGGSTTNTHTPAVGDLLVVVAASSGLSGGTTAVTDNNADGLGVYTQVDVDRTGFSTTGVLTVWIRNAPIGSATSTVVTAAQVGSSGGGLDVFRVSGMTRTGSGAARQTAGQSTGTSGTTPAPVMGSAVLTANPVIIAIATSTNGTANSAPRTSPAYTEATDLGYNTPATGLETQFVNSGETGTTLTVGATAPSAFASVAVELDTTAPITATGSITLTGTVNQGLLSDPGASAGASDRLGRYGRSIPPVTEVIRNPVSGPPPTTATGSITLTGTVSVTAAATATGSITLTAAQPTVTGFNATRGPIVVSPEPPRPQNNARVLFLRNPEAAAAVTATGSLTLTGTGSARAAGTASGSITLTAALVTVTGFNATRGPIVVTPEPQYRALPPRAFVTRNPPAAAGTTGTGSLTLTGTATLGARATATGSLTLTGTATLRAPVTPPGSITLNGSAAAKAVAGATGTLTLNGTATAVDTTIYPAGASDRLGRYGRSIPPVTRVIRSFSPSATTAAGSLTLTGTATVKAAAAATGSITLNGTATMVVVAGPARSVLVAGQAVQTAPRYRVVNPAIWTRQGAGIVGDLGNAFGTLTLTGTASVKAAATATGSITLNGTAASTAVPPRLGVLVAGQAIWTAPRYRAVPHPLTLRPKPSAAVLAGATGALTLTGTAAVRAPVTATGSITLTGQGTVHPPGPQPNGSLTLVGSATVKAAAPVAHGALTLTGTGTVRVVSAATGHLVLLGVATARAQLTAGTAHGTLTLTGAAAARVALAVAHGTLTLTGLVFLIRRDLTLTASVEGSRMSSAVESARLTSTVEGARLTAAVEGT